MADREGPRLPPRAAGDEPVLLADHLPGIPVVVGENRFEAGQVALSECGATAIVLDDGFQHRTLRKDLEILVINGRDPWGNRRLFPRGMLREPLSALDRADLFVVTNPLDRGRYRGRDRYHPASQHASPDPGGALPGGRSAGDAGRARRSRPLPSAAAVSWPSPDSARPGDLRTRWRPREWTWPGSSSTPITTGSPSGDLEDLAQHAGAIGAEGLITTEKDWIRLRSLASACRVPLRAARRAPPGSGTRAAAPDPRAHADLHRRAALIVNTRARVDHRANAELARRHRDGLAGPGGASSGSPGGADHRDRALGPAPLRARASLTFCFRTLAGLRERLDLGRSLRQEPPDLAILLVNSVESALAAWCWGARRRLGFDTDGRRLLLTDIVPLPSPRRHQIDEYALLLSADGRDGG